MKLNSIILLLLFLPLFSAALLAIFYRTNLRIYRRLTMLCMSLPLLPLFYFVYEAVQFGSLDSHVIYIESSISIISFSYGIDIVSLWLSIICCIVLLCAVMFGLYMKKRQKQFYLLAVLVQGAMLHIYLSRDALLLCTCLLFLMLFLMFLLGIWSEKDAARTVRTFAYRMLAGIFFITMSSILLLSIGSESQSSTVLLGDQVQANLQQYLQLADSRQERLLAFILLLLGLILIIPMFGLHRPFLNIVRNSPIIVAIMYSTMIGSVAIYIAYRLGLAYFADYLYSISKPAMWVLALQWLFTCISLWRQKDAKSWLAYSVWGQYSLLFILLFAESEIGLTMLWLQTLSFQLLVALLGGLLAAIYERTKTANFNEWSRQLNDLPFLSGLLVVSLLALLGLPGLSHFVGTYHALLLSFPVSRWITVCLMLGGLSSAAFTVRTLLKVQTDQPRTSFSNMTELRFIEAFPASMLLTIIIVIGLYPNIVIDLMEFELHKLYLFWQQTEQSISMFNYNLIDILRLNSEAWQLPVMISIVMSLVIWLVNHKQGQWPRMLFWQAVHHVLTLTVVLSSALALHAKLDMQRVVLIAIWYVVMFAGSYFMMKVALGQSGISLNGLQGLYYRQRMHAFLLLLFHLALMSAPLTAGFTFQLSMIELWSSYDQYGIIMLWLVAHALMATIPLENIIQMYMNHELDFGKGLHHVDVTPSRVQGQYKVYMLVSISSLLILIALAFWI